MTRKEALDFVNAEIKPIEMANLDNELRPWERNACPTAKEYWGWDDLTLPDSTSH